MLKFTIYKKIEDLKIYIGVGSESRVFVKTDIRYRYMKDVGFVKDKGEEKK